MDFQATEYIRDSEFVLGKQDFWSNLWLQVRKQQVRRSSAKTLEG